MLKKLPIPIAGLTLALAALGNLLQSYGENIRIILYFLSFAIFITLSLKIVLNFAGFKEELNNPVVASVFPTYSMSLMLYGGFLFPYNKLVASIVWYFGVALHIALIIYFTLKFAINHKKITVYPSWFIVYVGIAVSSVTGKNFNVNIGKGAFVFGFVSLIVLLFLNIRSIMKKNFPEPIKPTLAIMTAPASLCLTGYMNIFEVKNIQFSISLLIIAQLLYFYVIINLVNLLKLKFYPSYSSFTFPLVISATAIKLTNIFLINEGLVFSFLKYLVQVETFLAFTMVFYVLIKYIIFLSPSKNMMKRGESI